jgi:hypothetical protein
VPLARFASHPDTTAATLTHPSHNRSQAIMPSHRVRREAAITIEIVVLPKRFTEAEIQSVLNEVFNHKAFASIRSDSSISTQARDTRSPTAHGLIDYCQWCGWSNYTEKMTPHFEECEWRRKKLSKPTYWHLADGPNKACPTEGSRRAVKGRQGEN